MSFVPDDNTFQHPCDRPARLLRLLRLALHCACCLCFIYFSNLFASALEQ